MLTRDSRGKTVAVSDAEYDAIVEVEMYLRTMAEMVSITDNSDELFEIVAECGHLRKKMRREYGYSPHH